MQVTPTIHHWAYLDAIRQTAEEAVLATFQADFTQKGLHGSVSERAAVRSGGDVRRGLLAQIGHQGVIDYLNGHDIHVELERYGVMVAPVKGRAH